MTSCLQKVHKVEGREDCCPLSDALECSLSGLTCRCHIHIFKLSCDGLQNCQGGNALHVVIYTFHISTVLTTMILEFGRQVGGKGGGGGGGRVHKFRQCSCRRNPSAYQSRCWGPEEEAALVVPKDGQSLGLQVNPDLCTIAQTSDFHASARVCLRLHSNAPLSLNNFVT